jgi:Ca2+-binding EF-hand superfamily protein
MFVSHMQPQENDSQHLNELRQLFMDIDQNNDGMLSKLEIEQALVKAIETRPDDFLTTIFNDVDLNNNGTIDYHEFMLAA